MKSFFLVIILALSSTFSFAQKELIDEIIAKVGSEIVLLSDIEEQHALIQAQQGTVDPNTRCFILDNLLSQRLMLNQARLDSIMVEEIEVDAQLDTRIERILAYMNGDVTQFEAYYGKSVNEVREQFRDDLRNQILIERMQGQIMANVQITPSEVKEFFSSIPLDSLPYFNSEVELGEIVYVPKVNAEQKELARKKLEGIEQQLAEGGDFAELAATFSDDKGSARAGGDLGWARRNTFVPEFEAAAYNLEENQISAIIETEFGFHIIQLLERRGNTIHARHILVKPAITEDDLLLAETELTKVRKSIAMDSLSFSRAVKKHSSDKVQSYNNDGNMVNPKTGNTFFEIGDLEPDIYFSIDTMQVSKLSMPIKFQQPTGETAYRLVYLKSRTKPHKANLKEDYSKIRQAALESKKSIFINNWVSEKIEETYIQIDNNSYSCENVNKWLIKP